MSRSKTIILRLVEMLLEDIEGLEQEVRELQALGRDPVNLLHACDGGREGFKPRLRRSATIDRHPRRQPETAPEPPEERFEIHEEPAVSVTAPAVVQNDGHSETPKDDLASGVAAATDSKPEKLREMGAEKITAHLMVSLDAERTIEELGLVPKHSGWVHRKMKALRERLAPYKPQSVVAAIQAWRDGDSHMTVRTTFEPPMPPDASAHVWPFLNAWASHLKSLPPLKEREEKARLVATLERWK